MVGGGVKDVQLTHKDAAHQPMHLFKIVIIGTENVGKTCFLRRFVDQTFTENYSATIGVDFATKTFEIGQGDLIKLQAWDTAGQERFHTITNTYYRGAHGIILMYDVTNRQTFDQLSYWMGEVEKMTMEDRIVVLVAGKADASEADRQVSSEEGRKFADERNIMFFEASAKEDTNVTNVFQELSEQLLLRHKQESSSGGAVGSTMRGPVKEKSKKETAKVKLRADKRGELEKKNKKSDKTVDGGVKDVQSTHKNAGQPTNVFKIMIVGTESVGKTCFLHRFVNDIYDETSYPTIGVDFSTKTFERGHGELIKLQVWDTAGQERFRTITNSYYRGAHGIIVMYDVTNRRTFDQLSYWMEQIENLTMDDTSRLVVLVASKADAGEADRQVSSEEGKKFADERHIMFFEASAKENTNVTNVFQELSEKLVLNHNNKRSCAPGPFSGPVKRKSKMCYI